MDLNLLVVKELLALSDDDARLYEGLDLSTILRNLGFSRSHHKSITKVTKNRYIADGSISYYYNPKLDEFAPRYNLFTFAQSDNEISETPFATVYQMKVRKDLSTDTIYHADVAIRIPMITDALTGLNYLIREYISDGLYWPMKVIEAELLQILFDLDPLRSDQ